MVMVHGFGKGKAFAVLVLTFLIFGVLIPAISLAPFLIGIIISFR
jgi:hypothetical protein